jgi:hypothetical protein
MLNDQLIDQLVVGLVLQVVMTLALAAWGRWVAKRRGGTRAWTWAARGPWASFVVLTVGMLITIRMLMNVFDGLANSDPARKQQILSEGIARAMTVSAMFIVPGYLILIVCVTMFIVGSIKAPAVTQDRQRI